jgi:hypothetical protein
MLYPRQFRVVFCVLCLCLGVSSLFAQFTSNVEGTVQDQSGAVLPKATVRLRNTSTGVEVTTVSGESGTYRFSSLAPGTYEVTAEAAGFQASKSTISVFTAQTAAVNLSLAVAGASTQVSVTSETPPIATDDSRTQMTVRTQQLQDLPVQGRNFLSLVAVAPGITGHGAVGGGAPGDASDNFSTEKTVDASGNGRNQSGNEFTLDGLNITSNILQGTANLSPNPDSIQEMAVQTNTFNVEHGRGSSVQVAMTTKSGSNQFHGTGAYFFTNQHLWARTEFTPKYEPFKKHDISATLGGPIIKNHTFFFASMEPLRSQVSQATSVQTFESPQFVAFAQSAFPNTIGTQLLTQYPLTNIGILGTSQTAQQLFGSACGTPATGNIPCNLPVVDQGTFKPSPFRNALQYNFRIDQYFEKDRFYFSLYKVDLDTEGIFPRQGFHDIGNNNTNAYQLSYTHIFTPTLLNEFSYGQIRVQGSSGETKGIPFHVPDIGITGVDTGISGPWGPATFIQHNYNWRDVVSWVKGSHSLKFGYEFWTGDDDAQFAGPYYRPHFQFNNLLDLVRDQPFEESDVNFDPLTGKVANGAYRHLLSTNGVFVQDEWRAKPNLTLSLGIRWDDYGNPHPDLSKTPPEGNVFRGPGNDLNTQFANAFVKQVNATYAGRLNNNWSPRIGVAYNPDGNGKTLIRGGIGLYHNWIPLGEDNRIRQNPPGLITPTFRVGDPIPPVFALGTSDAPPFGFPFPTLPAGQLDAKGGLVGVRASAGGIDRNIHADSSVIYNIGVDRQLPGRLVAGVLYSGSYTYNGVMGTDYNRFPGDLLDGTLDRLNSSFGTIYYEANRNVIKYNAGIFSVRQTLGRSAWQASYTLSKVTDYGQAGSRINRDPGYAVPTQYNLSQYEAPADWDARHRFSLSGTYEIPSPRWRYVKTLLGGWEFGSVWILQSGNPITIYTSAPFTPILGPGGAVIGLAPGSGDYNADGVNFDFPNAPSIKLPTSFSRQQYINGIALASDFPAPAPGTEGNLKRATYRNPGFANIDASLIKNNRFETWSREINLQLRFEFFNVLNRVNLQAIQSDLSSASFGRSISTYDPRILQLGARLVF